MEYSKIQIIIKTVQSVIFQQAEDKKCLEKFKIQNLKLSGLYDKLIKALVQVMVKEENNSRTFLSNKLTSTFQTAFSV